jgi:Carboxypeptidase regulatory-like domain
MVRLLCIFCALAAAVPAMSSDKKSADQPAANLHFTVVRDANNKPVRAASVVLHTVNKDGTQAKGGLQLKTDGEGNAGIDGIPYGPLRIQVLAPGFQTYGDDYQINKPEMEIEFRLKRPGDQLSIYEKDKQKAEAPASQPPAPPATPPADPKPN